MELIASYTIKDLLIFYYKNPTQGCEWVILPKNKAAKFQLPQRLKFDSLIQVKLAGDDFPKGFTNGTTMRNSETTKSLQFVGQTSRNAEEKVTIATTLKDKHQNLYTHYAIVDQKTAVIETYVTFENQSGKNQKLELLTSFSLSNLTPFYQKNPTGNLFLTRYRSKWSFEGRKEKQAIEEFQLEPSWKPSGAGIVKFGQVGSMPVRGFFPVMFVADAANEVTWGMKLAHPGSWQMEAYRLDEDLCLAGGLADRDYGQWAKNLAPNESFTTPRAYLTAVVGNEEVCGDRFNQFHTQKINQRNHKNELGLATMFNEFCTTWGAPSAASIRKSLAVLKKRKLDYYVIDAGWYADEEKGWEKNMGDWVVNPKQFPQGIGPIIEEIRAAGMIPGIWFEIETVGRDATVFHAIDHLLKRDNFPITTGDRRFWDMNDPWVIDYLSDKVIGFLQKHKIGYLKIDYNDNFGVGFDHPESFGEANRQQLAGTRKFFEKIQTVLPELVIENCSSGGHRLEPSMYELTDLSSFSDAHETTSIPIISANLHELMPPQQSLIWAVLRKEDTLQRIYYSMTATFLGRVCLSGDIHELTDAQWQAVDDGLAFYQKVKHLVKEGRSQRFGPEILSYRQPVGQQGIVRYHKNSQEALVILHGFCDAQTLQLELAGSFEIAAAYGQTAGIKLDQNHLSCQFTEDFQGAALYLKKFKSLEETDDFLFGS